MSKAATAAITITPNPLRTMLHSALIAAAVALSTLLPIVTEDHQPEAEVRVEAAAESRPDQSVVAANSTDYWTITLQAGVPTTIIVDGDGDTDLDVYLYDDNGNLIDSDTDLTDFCVVSVTPRWTAEFTVKIVNLGGVYNVYDIYTR